MEALRENFASLKARHSEVKEDLETCQAHIRAQSEEITRLNTKLEASYQWIDKAFNMLSEVLSASQKWGK